MIRLHPSPDAEYTCPYCQVPLTVRGWYIPGMRNLVDLECPQCGREFYGDLSAGHGLYYPMLLERDTGVVHDKYGINWFASWLHDSYANRTDVPVEFSVEQFRSLNQPILLNCLDKLYGHCLLKLLNAQYYLDHRPDFDLIVLIPRFLRWMVPEGVAAIWMVDLPLRRGIEWNDWLAAEIKRRVESLETCWLSVAFSHPHPEDYDIERFTRVRPFPIDEWDIRLKKPTVAFIWREDRLWNTALASRLLTRVRGYVNRSGGEIECFPFSIHEQSRKIIKLAKRLKERFPTLDFAVAGLGKLGGFPDWIQDLRVAKPDEAAERILCERYARSHVVIGVHGSNMLLPSAHAGAVVELMLKERWGNVLQDLLLRKDDQRETLFRYRVLPTTTSADTLCDVVSSVLLDRAGTLLNMQRRWCQHEHVTDVLAWREACLAVQERRQERLY